MANGAVRFAREALTDSLLSEMVPLLHAHWREIAHYSDIPLAPDFDAYRAMVASGALRVFTARDALGLVGYAVWIVRNAPHYAGSRQAVQDILFLEPAARGLNGIRFLRWCDQALAAEGVQVAHHHVKMAHNWGPILERMGYEAVDVIYSRRLDREAVHGRDGSDRDRGDGRRVDDLLASVGEPAGAGPEGRDGEAAVVRPERGG